MVKRKPIRSRGKILFSQYFKSSENSDIVAVKVERAVKKGFPDNLQGRTGVVKERRGHCYVISMNDKNKVKEHIIHPIHLKKLKNSKQNK